MKHKTSDIDLDMISAVDFLEDRGVDYMTAGNKNISAGWIGLSCPWCGDHSTHLGISLETNLVSCFRCGKKGSVIHLIQQIDSCSMSKAESTALKFVSTDFSHLIKKERKHAETTLYPTGTGDTFLPIHDNFLARRRYDRKFIQQRYDILAVGPTCDDWKFRIIIPIFLDGELVSYVGRDCTDKADIKYKNVPAERCTRQVKDCVYGIDTLKQGGVGIIVEGVFDAWRLGKYALPTFGTQYTTNQLALVARKKLSKLYVCFDQDAHTKGDELAHTVSSVCNDVELILLDEGDPDDLTEDEVWELRRELNLK
jgi:DNA primase